MPTSNIYILKSQTTSFQRYAYCLVGHLTLFLHTVQNKNMYWDTICQILVYNIHN